MDCDDPLPYPPLVTDRGITTCCDAMTTIFIDDGSEYCKCCYRTVTPAANAEPCHDCSVAAGEAHLDGCDVARCLVTGLQRLSCMEDHDCGCDVWRASWPGNAECIKYDLILGELPNGEILGDLNTLYVKGTWNRAKQRWEMPSG